MANMMKKTGGGIHQPDVLKYLLLAIFVALIGSSTAAYGQEFSDSFETTPDFINLHATLSQYPRDSLKKRNTVQIAHWPHSPCNAIV